MRGLLGVHVFNIISKESMDRPLPKNSKFKNSDYERLHRARLEQIAGQKEDMVDITVVRSVKVNGHAGYVPDDTTKHSLSIQFLRSNNMDEVRRELDVPDDMHLTHGYDGPVITSTDCFWTRNTTTVYISPTHPCAHLCGES